MRLKEEERNIESRACETCVIMMVEIKDDCIATLKSVGVKGIKAAKAKRKKCCQTNLLGNAGYSLWLRNGVLDWEINLLTMNFNLN